LLIEGFGCHQERSDRICGNHDLFSTLTDWRGFHRILTTDAEVTDLALGGEHKLRRAIRRLLEAKKPDAVAVAPSVVMETSGQFHSPVLAEVERTQRVPIIEVSGSVLDGDWLDGYADFLLAMARTQIRTARPRGKKKGRVVAIIGHLMSRLEFDEQANLAEMRHLLRAAGLQTRSIWLSGRRFRSHRLDGLSAVIGLPYGIKAARTLAEAAGVPLIATGLPLGFEGSAAWLRAIAAELGLQDRAESVVKKELKRYIPRFEWAVSGCLAGRSVAVCADPHLAAGLANFLPEMGMRVVLTCIESRHDIRSPEQQAADGDRVMIDPGYADLKARLKSLAANGDLDLVIGNSLKRDMVDDRIPFLELGFPSYLYHCFTDSPFLGFRGAVFLLQRIINLLSIRNAASSPESPASSPATDH
jgi:nitrogenase molybdenum-iron protein alpha/beta subunit